jgi:hypothetical protein
MGRFCRGPPSAASAAGQRRFGQPEQRSSDVAMKLSIPAHTGAAGVAYRPAITAARVMGQPLDPSANDRHRRPTGAARLHLERCWRHDCDIDPMILRLRLLRHQGSHAQARCLEQELLPLF